jgi:hypothetical protein
LGSFLLKKARKVENCCQLHEFNWLKLKWKKWYVNPSFCPIMHYSNREGGNKKKKSSEKYMFRVFLKNLIRSFCDKSEYNEPNEYVGYISKQVKMIVWILQLPGTYHERSNFVRWVYTHRTNHNHSEYNEPQYYEEYSIINGFGLHLEQNRWNVKTNEWSK